MASRDQVWLIDFGDPFPAEPASMRPAVVVGPDPAWGQSLPNVVVIPLTTTRRGLIGLHVEIEPDERNALDETSYAQCEQLRSVNERRLLRHLGEIDSGVSMSIERTIRDILGY